MEPFLIIVVPGLLGGIVMALLFIRFQRAPRAQDSVPGGGRLQPPGPNFINMASIRVAGVGGLGMVAMAVTVAIFVPRIRLTMAIALLLGAALAVALIARRRREGPLSSGSHGPGAHSLLSIGPPAASPGSENAASRPGGSHELAALPAKG